MDDSRSYHSSQKLFRLLSWNVKPESFCLFSPFPNQKLHQVPSMASRRLPKTCILEVERKFRSLAVPKLTQYGGLPHFKSLQSLPVKVIHDAYYDKDKLLSQSGAWVRNRDGTWEAKLKKGGNFLNSKFEELRGIEAISAYIKRATGIEESETRNFGLQPIAVFTTTRETWIADGEFHVTLDQMDFGHQVGEVELQKAIVGADGEEPTELQKQAEMQLMDERIVQFMQTYKWAFTEGRATGKVSAYFEWKRKHPA
ncbi:CYTH-like domain-containing protein [Trichoderma longibrachiatum]